MDCRRSLAVSVNLVWLVCGCVGSQTRLATSASPAPEAPPPSAVQKDAAGPKRLPKANTVVAAGAWQETEAAKAENAPRQQALRDQARMSYQEALRLDANCLPAYLGLGRVYTDMGDFDR